ncbi:Alpha/beta hydrolase family protein [Rubripirellula tenax]|uniref:Alpha/beta hydrolase family protein n=1 Tax=Rubripirellula tenax TaxID=2528015 RepID=A0A5C6FDL1_9BACT|nr:lipase [Rubripirellula tenax]TWU58747.1 Alpha/beta hydrolase family protein [Rubripirellula tenax]
MRTILVITLLTLAVAIVGGVTAESSAADENDFSDSDDSMTAHFNIPTKTGGGTQLWTDHVYRGGFRVQQNVWTGHWRLIDDADVRRAWGSREGCQAKLDRMKPLTAKPDATSQHVIVLLHGLMRTHHCMKPLEADFAKAGFTNVVRFSYASSRSSIGDHASALREIMEAMPTDTQFSFVGHSMGNIVVRHLIGDLQRASDPSGVLGRCRSMVMLGPPNQGAAIATRLAPTGVYGWLTGKGGLELGPQWKEFEGKLATPPFPFMIIAGDVSKNLIQNPLVDGSSDFVVSVEEATLEGAEAIETVAVLHSFLMNDAGANKMTVDFIKSH